MAQVLTVWDGSLGDDTDQRACQEVESGLLVDGSGSDEWEPTRVPSSTSMDVAPSIETDGNAARVAIAAADSNQWDLGSA
ncbi:MAG: hypothetical protein WD895_02115 [Acidimicrobiia bacterium]